MAMHKLNLKKAEMISNRDYDEETIDAINSLLIELQLTKIQIKTEDIDEMSMGERFTSKLILTCDES